MHKGSSSILQGTTKLPTRVSHGAHVKNETADADCGSLAKRYPANSPSPDYLEALPWKLSCWQMAISSQDDCGRSSELVQTFAMVVIKTHARRIFALDNRLWSYTRSGVGCRRSR